MTASIPTTQENVECVGEKSTNRTRFRFRVFIAPVILTTIVLLAALPTLQANATTLNVWQPYQRDSVYNYVLVPTWNGMITSSFTEARNNALWDWYNTNTPIYPYHADFDSSQLDWYENNTWSDQYVGYAQPEDANYDGRVDFWHIHLNQNLHNYDYYGKRLAAVHEMGHALGLDHPNDGSTYTVMYKDLRPGLGYYSPRAYDVADINRFYNWNS